MLAPWHGWLLLLACAGLTGFAFARRARARTLADTPLTRIRSAAQGYLELSGTARLLPGEPVLAPLTARACAWWEFSVEERVSDDGRQRWRVIAEGRSESIFALEDGTGQVVIDPTGAEVTAPHRDVWRGPTERPPAGPPAGTSVLGSNYRYTERLILPAQTLCVVGELRTQRPLDTAPDLEAEIATRLRALKHDAQALAALDLDHDGQLSLAEWEQARTRARAEVLAARHADGASPGIALIARPRDGRPYLIGALPREALTRRYRRQALMLAGAALVLLGAGLWLLTGAR